MSAICDRISVGLSVDVDIRASRPQCCGFRRHDEHVLTS